MGRTKAVSVDKAWIPRFWDSHSFDFHCKIASVNMWLINQPSEKNQLSPQIDRSTIFPLNVKICTQILRCSGWLEIQKGQTFHNWKTSSDLYWWSSNNQFSLFFYTKACKSNWRVECLLIELRKNVHFRNSPIRPLHLLFRKPPSHYILQLNGDAVFHFSKSRVHNQLTKYFKNGTVFLHGRKKNKKYDTQNVTLSPLQ